MKSTISKLLLVLYTLIIHFCISAQTRTFEVSLINGVSLRASNIEIINQDEENCHLSLDRSQNVPINLVRVFENANGVHIVKDIPGKGPSIFKRQLDGAISIYELTNKSWYQSATGGGGLQIEQHQLYLFNNEFKKLEISNLKNDLKDHPKLLKRLKKLSNYRLARTAGFFISIGLMGYGASQMFEYTPAQGSTEFNFKMNPPFLSGIIALFGTIGIIKKTDDSILKIIQTYNFEQELQNKFDQ